MVILIQDESVVAEINRLAEGLEITPEEAVRRAVEEKNAHLNTPPLLHSSGEMLAAIADFQEWFAAHRDPKDTRTPDEIIGYNEHGHFD